MSLAIESSPAERSRSHPDIGPGAFLKRIDHDVPGVRRVDGDQCLPDRER